MCRVSKSVHQKKSSITNTSMIFCVQKFKYHYGSYWFEISPLHIRIFHKNKKGRQAKMARSNVQLFSIRQTCLISWFLTYKNTFDNSKWLWRHLTAGYKRSEFLRVTNFFPSFFLPCRKHWFPMFLSHRYNFEMSIFVCIKNV